MILEELLAVSITYKKCLDDNILNHCRKKTRCTSTVVIRVHYHSFAYILDLNYRANGKFLYLPCKIH